MKSPISERKNVLAIASERTIIGCVCIVTMKVMPADTEAISLR
jgi:hypothetical protein